MSQKGFPEMAAEAYNRVRFVKRRDSSENNPGELILDEEYRWVWWNWDQHVNLIIVSFIKQHTQIHKEGPKQEQPSSLLQLPVSEEGLEPLSCQDYFEKKWKWFWNSALGDGGA